VLDAAVAIRADEVAMVRSEGRILKVDALALAASYIPGRSRQLICPRVFLIWGELIWQLKLRA